jgi:hypothetical protein
MIAAAIAIGLLAGFIGLVLYTLVYLVMMDCREDER